jgi:adenine-specific DNA-methyltransferase
VVNILQDLVANSYELGKRILEKRQAQTLKEHGQFLTPPSVARYMAKQLGEIPSSASLLEPAIGSGVLICAVIEQLISENCPVELWIDAYDTDADLCDISRRVLTQATQKAKESGVIVHWQVNHEDFILACMPESQPTLFANSDSPQKVFDYVISNPPYFKLNADNKQVKAVSGKLNGHTNIYTLFMALSTKLLKPQGRACFIVPRSFCSGVYFSEFRRDMLRDVTPLAAHLFQSRDEIFKGDDVLQENVIFTFEKSTEPNVQKYWAGFIRVSTSKDDLSMEGTQISRQVSFRHFLSHQQEQLFFRLPTGVLDEQILDVIDRWDGSLEQYGLQVSTGRVVPFRARSYLRDSIGHQNGIVPLLWMQNVKPYKVMYPLAGFDKPQAITIDDVSLLVPNTNYILLRRFSAKEDRRRLIAASLIGEDFPYSQIGFENHLNFIYRKMGTLDKDETIGLSALLNSAIIDRYFRIVNGNTQVNAAELRALPLPPMDVIRQIGKRVLSVRDYASEAVDDLVFSTLRETKMLEEDFPMIRETRITMGKIEQAQEILESIGLPSAQQNEMAALTLLVLAQISEDTPWRAATTRSFRVHDLLFEIKERYGREYAENTRETIRRQALHQFEQAGVVIRNPDDPTLATNSPLTHYCRTEPLLATLRTFGTSKWTKARTAFLEQRGVLVDVYQKAREYDKVPLHVADGNVVKLSPGKHNQLQVSIVEEFGPRFAPGAKLIYLGDAAHKAFIFEKDLFAKLGVTVSDHGKLPDIVLYADAKNWVYLIEAVTSHGPVSPKRYVELEELFKNCSAGRVYVSAFPGFTTFKKFINEIAWETEVWIAENPSHLIHFNGDKFLGPR